VIEYESLKKLKESTMGQVLHGCAKTIEAVRKVRTHKNELDILKGNKKSKFD
jgi:hypothetical protein